MANEDANVSIEVLEALSEHLGRFCCKMDRINKSISVGLSNYYRKFEELLGKLRVKMEVAEKKYDETVKNYYEAQRKLSQIIHSISPDNQQECERAVRTLCFAEGQVKMSKMYYEKCQANYCNAVRLVGSCSEARSSFDKHYQYISKCSKFAQSQLSGLINIVRQYDWISYRNHTIAAPHANESDTRKKSDSEPEQTGIRSITIVDHNDVPAANSITLIDQTPLNGFGTIQLIANKEGVFIIPDNLKSDDCAIYIHQQCIYRGVLTDKIHIYI